MSRVVANAAEAEAAEIGVRTTGTAQANAINVTGTAMFAFASVPAGDVVVIAAATMLIAPAVAIYATEASVTFAIPPG